MYITLKRKHSNVDASIHVLEVQNIVLDSFIPAYEGDAYCPPYGPDFEIDMESLEVYLLSPLYDISKQIDISKMSDNYYTLFESQLYKEFNIDDYIKKQRDDV